MKGEGGEGGEVQGEGVGMKDSYTCNLISFPDLGGTGRGSG